MSKAQTPKPNGTLVWPEKKAPGKLSSSSGATRLVSKGQLVAASVAQCTCVTDQAKSICHRPSVPLSFVVGRLGSGLTVPRWTCL